MAEWLRSWTGNRKVGGSIPTCMENNVDGDPPASSSTDEVPLSKARLKPSPAPWTPSTTPGSFEKEKLVLKGLPWLNKG